MQRPSRPPGWSARWIGLFALMALLLGTLSPLAPVAAQKDKGEKFEEEKLPALTGVDTGLVAASGAGYLVVSPNDILDHPLLKQTSARLRESIQNLEREIPTRLGVRLRQLQRLTIAFPVGPMNAPVVLLRGTGNQEFDTDTVSKNLGGDWKFTKQGDRISFRSPRNNDVLLVYNPNLLLLGQGQDVESFLERARIGRTDPTLHRGLASAEAGAHFVVGARPENLAGLLMRHRYESAPATRIEKKSSNIEKSPLPAEKGPGRGPGSGDGPPGAGPGAGPGGDSPPGSGPGTLRPPLPFPGPLPRTGPPRRPGLPPSGGFPPSALGGPGNFCGSSFVVQPAEAGPESPGTVPPPGGTDEPIRLREPTPLPGFPFPAPPLGASSASSVQVPGDPPGTDRVFDKLRAGGQPTEHGTGMGGPEQSMAEVLRELPAFMLPYKPLFQCRAGYLSVRLGEESAAVTLTLGYAKPEQTEDGVTALKTTLYVLREALPRLWLESVTLKKESALEVIRSLDRVVEGLKKATVQVNGRSIEATATLPLEAASVGALLNETQFDLHLDAEQRNHLKQIGLAIHSYHDTFGALPGTAYYSAQGKPLLSWRVAILPYIEQANLYNQFKLDEPWDSPNNIKLLDKMPKTFAPPPGVKVEAGHTFIQGFSGPGTIFDPERDKKTEKLCSGIRIFDITDGTSNTAMVGESGKSVPWTKPEDIPATGQAVPPLGCVPGSDRCLVLMGDGSVHTISTRPPLAAFRTMVGRSDGIPFDIDDLKPGKVRPESPR
jgi:hypothetical protein